MRKAGSKKRGKISVRNIYRDRFKKKKKFKTLKNVSDSDEEDLNDTFWLYCLGAYSRSASREMWIKCMACKLLAAAAYTNFVSISFSSLSKYI
jgi:uncharacterized cysteine cluster protein YcgN (CxxCxxCC family)